MEKKPHALASEETSNEGLASSCDQGVVNADPCPAFVPQVAVPEEEEVVACDQGVVNAEPCKELGPEVAVPEEEEAKACAQDADPCKELEPEVAVAEEEEAKACAQDADPCKELEPEVAVPEEEEAKACAQDADPCKELEPEVAVAEEEEAKACAQDADLCKELEPEVAVPEEEEAEDTKIKENEVYLTIDDCSGELQPPLPANGDGDGAPDENGSEAWCASEAEINPSAEEIITERGLISSPPPEPSWGDVPDEPVTVPVAVTPRFLKQPRPAPENVEVDDIVQTMRNILMDLRNADDARLNADDEVKVRSLLEYHPKSEEKTGSGIDYIKIKRHSTFKDVRCFWVVRTDGSETDFSYHKCLKEKVAKDHPSFVDRYDAVYRQPKRPRQA